MRKEVNKSGNKNNIKNAIQEILIFFQNRIKLNDGARKRTRHH
jgi:hypothetical protein